MAAAYHPSPNTARTVYRLGGFLMVQCLSATCAHQGRLSAKALIDQGRGDVNLGYAARRMKCTACGALGAKVEVQV